MLRFRDPVVNQELQYQVVCVRSSGTTRKRGFPVNENLSLQLYQSHRRRSYYYLTTFRLRINDQAREDRAESPPSVSYRKPTERRIPLSFHPSFLLTSLPPSLCFSIPFREGGARPARLGFIPKAVCTLAGE